MSDDLDPRVAELLSADVDGALSGEEREVARQWVERSAAARAERASLAAVKAAVAGLPPVEAPPGFLEALVPAAPRRRRAPVLAGVAAAAAWVAVAGSGATAVTPPVEDVEEALRDDGGRFALREQAGEVAWSELPDGDRGDHDGTATWVDRTAPRGMARIVVARDDLVLTLASDDLDAGALVAVAVAELEERSARRGGDGILDRLRRACERLVGSG